MIQDRLKALRSEMAKRGISLYVVPTADFHESEYVCKENHYRPESST